MGFDCSRIAAAVQRDVWSPFRDFSQSQFSAPAYLRGPDVDSCSVYPGGEKSRGRRVADFCCAALNHCSAVAGVERSRQQSRTGAVANRCACVLRALFGSADEYEHLRGHILHLHLRLTFFLLGGHAGVVPRDGLDGSDVTLAVYDSFVAARRSDPGHKVHQNQTPCH